MGMVRTGISMKREEEENKLAASWPNLCNGRKLEEGKELEVLGGVEGRREKRKTRGNGVFPPEEEEEETG